MKLTIQITEEDIRLGQQFRAEHCAVAMALRRATGLTWAVGGTFAHIGATTVVLPEALAAFAGMFDVWGHECKPPTRPFTFEVPDCLFRLLPYESARR